MVKWTYARTNKKFELTEEGKKENHVKAKFADGYSQRGRYEKCVPQTWVKQGYVKEVERGTE